MEIWCRAGLPVALIAVALCVLSVSSETELAPLDLSVPADPGADDLGATVLALDGPNGPFSEIPNIAVSHGAREVNAADRTDCQEACSSDISCKSASYSAATQKCLVSPASLRYHPGWQLHMKEMKMSAIGLMKPTGKYDGFPSVRGIHDVNFEDSSSDMKTCQRRCDAEENCASYSYNSQEMKCNLSGDGVTFDPRFIYYEKNAPAQTPESKEDKPVDVATSEEEEELEEPRFVPPDDSELNAKLAATRARVEQVDKELKSENPVINLSKKKEKVAKQNILLKERNTLRKATKVRLQSQEVHKLMQETSSIQYLTKQEEVSAPGVIRATAKAAFRKGYERQAKIGTSKYQREKAKLEEEARKSKEDYTGADPNSGMIKMMNAQKEKVKKQESMQAFKKNERSKERSKKALLHEQALLLSKRSSALIAKELQAKQMEYNKKEKKVKDRHRKQNAKLSKDARERGDKKLALVTASDAQTEAMRHLKLTQAVDQEKTLQQKIELMKELKVKSKEVDPEVIRARRMEAASGVKEQGLKDEQKERIRAQKKAKAKAYATKLKVQQQAEELADLKAKAAAAAKNGRMTTTKN